MLPFTKRPGRDESGEEDVLTKDDLVVPAATAPATKAKESKSARAKFPSLNDEEMTTLMSSKSLGDARPSVRPAAGAPPPSRSAPPSKASSPGGAPSSRSPKFAALESDEEEDGRTVVRGAPKIVKRGAASAGAKMGMPTSPTTISPAAVIKATLESARAGVKPRTGGDHLMAGPPQDLLEDIADRHLAERQPPADVGAEHTAILKSPTIPPGMIQGVKALSTQMMQPQALPQGTIPPGSARPMSVPPPPSSQHPPSQSGGYATQSGGYATQSGGYATQSGGYAQLNGPVPSGSVSVPGVSMGASMPAHFMVPQPPYSDGRIDPPGTAVTQRGKAAGRSGMSWAMALAAFGICVGVGAVAVMKTDGVVETSASFVDPSRAGAGKAAAAQAAAAQAAAPAAAPTGVPVATEQPATVGVPPVAIPATPPAVATTTAPAVAAPSAPPVATVAAVTAPATPAVPAAAATAAAAARPVVAVAAQPRPAAPAPAPAPRPVARPAADEPAAAAPKPTKPGKGGKGGEVDDETKKALDELQKAQLERSF
jgi:hypothetical protein